MAVVEADDPDGADDDEIDDTFYGKNLGDGRCFGDQIGSLYHCGPEAEKNQEDVDSTFDEGHDGSGAGTKITDGFEGHLRLVFLFCCLHFA
ncbi:MAG: hypothetical protein ACYS9T_05090 [Planctomycetota bacterium]